ncbi:MAG: heme o synthase [Gemmatimonadota bacterium]
MPTQEHTADRAAPSLARSYYELTKPGIAGFAMMTAGVSYYVATAGRADFLPVLYTLAGMLLASAGALALNQYAERDLDALMDRTRRRPLPSGRIRPRDALAFGLVLVAAGASLLWVTVGTLPALLTLVSAAAYNLIYTPLKSRSYAATLAGAIPGGMPALIGWSAATGEVTLGALVLFGIGFLWQIPHVLALAWLLREDYARAGFLMAPPADPEGRTIGRHMILYASALIPVSLLPTPLGLTGTIYLVGALALGAMLLGFAVVARGEMSRRAVRRVFLGSLAYQPLLLALMLVDTVRG